jgi:hypothetical protein
MRILRSALVALLSAAVGLLVFYLTALTSGEPWRPAWEREGAAGVALWAYERASIATVIILFLLALACGWRMRSDRLLAATSLALFYPVFAIARIVLGVHTGNLLPFEFAGYAIFIAICLLGYVAGRWLFKRIPRK